MEAVVVHSDEVAPEELISGASVRTTLGPAAGCPRLIQRLVHLPRRAIATSTVEGAGELWHISRGEVLGHQISGLRLGRDSCTASSVHGSLAHAVVLSLGKRPGNASGV